MISNAGLLEQVSEHADLHYDGEFTLIRKKDGDTPYWLFCFQRVDEVDSGIEELMAKGKTADEAMKLGLELDISYIEIEANIWNSHYQITDLLEDSVVERLNDLPQGIINEFCSKKIEIRDFVLNGYLVKKGKHWLVSQQIIENIKKEHNSGLCPF